MLAGACGENGSLPPSQQLLRAAQSKSEDKSVAKCVCSKVMVGSALCLSSLCCVLCSLSIYSDCQLQALVAADLHREVLDGCTGMAGYESEADKKLLGCANAWLNNFPELHWQVRGRL